MSSVETFTLIQGSNQIAFREVFETHYSRMSSIAKRYAKNQSQTEELINYAFNEVFKSFKRVKSFPEDLDRFVEERFIIGAIEFIKSFRSEYYVASTVYAATESKSKNYNLFDNIDSLDFSEVDNDLLVEAIQLLVPSQRLVFNLHVIEGYTLEKTAELLESSQATVKSNLEKARFSLQKNIEKSFKTAKA